MRKLNIEIHPYSRKGLAPRYHITQTLFRNIRSDKMVKFNQCCEACGETDSKMELHEAATIKNRTYVLDGFYLLCRKCHDMVHCINISSNRFGVNKNTIDYTFKKAYDIKGRSIFNTKALFDAHVDTAFDRVFDFMMADQVSCDYSKAAKYGLDPKNLHDAFNRNYNHFACRISYMANYLWWFFKREEIGMKVDQTFYDQYAKKKKVKDRIAILHQEYMQHKAYYDDNKVLYGISCPEREKVILDYADIMKTKLTVSKHKSKTSIQ